MQIVSRLARLSVVSFVLVLGFGGAVQAATPAQKCQSTIIKESAKFVAAKAKALQKCEESIIKGAAGFTSPPGSRCNDSGGKTSSKIAKAETKFKSKVDGACGGADKTCRIGDDDIALASIGWNIGACPDFELKDCTNTILHCGGVSSDGKGITDCLLCLNETAVDQAMDLYANGLAPGEFGTSSAVNKCQATIGKETTKFMLAKSKALSKCWDAVNNAKPGFAAPCPSGDAAGKTQAAIDKAESKKIVKLCKACGGPEKACDLTVGPVAGSGSSDDFSPATIGFAQECPAVILPYAPNTDCGALDDVDGAANSIDSLRELILCVDCVTEYKVDCIDLATVPDFAAYPGACNVCVDPVSTGVCPTSMVLTANGPDADLDSGWIGIGHDFNIPTNGRLTFTVSGCDNANHPCGECTLGGPILNTGGPEFHNQRCSDKPWIQCTSNLDCTNAGATGPCVFFFGPPLPISAGAVPVCVLNEVTGIATGTVNIEDGSSATLISIRARTHPTGTIDQPCANCLDVKCLPTCNGGPQNGEPCESDANCILGSCELAALKCDGGVSDGNVCASDADCVGKACDNGPRADMPCTVNGDSELFGPVSLDCPPNPGSNAGNLPITLPLATGTQTRDLTAASPFCRASAFQTKKCFCDTCNNINAEPCMSDADCPDNPIATPGICGGPRCLGGGDAGEVCAIPADCDSGNCGNPGGTDTAPNACTNAICIAQPADTGSINEGQCALAPNDNLCSIETFRTCTNNAQCNPPEAGGTCSTGCLAGQTCTVKRRECFTDNGVIGKHCFRGTNAEEPCNSIADCPDQVTPGVFCGGGTVQAGGVANVPCGNRTRPTLGALFCIAHTGASAVNQTAGLPGLGRLTLRAKALFNP